MKERNDPAKQFMPFAALVGFDSMVREREKIIMPQKELSEEENELLSQKMSDLRKGMFVKIRYYRKDAYEFIEGRVMRIDTVFRTITVTKTTISFDDISKITVSS